MGVLDVLDDALCAHEGGAAVAALQLHVEALRVLLQGGALQEGPRAVLQELDVKVRPKIKPVHHKCIVFSNVARPYLALVGAARGRLRVHGDGRHEGRPPGRGAQDAVVLLMLLPSRVGLRGARRGRVVVEPVSEVGRGRRRAVVQLLGGHGTVLQVDGGRLS